MSASSSFGARDMAASLAQNINDRTQQNASSARSRRASIVSEVSQSEHESITTRVVTNYNHMHALNVQYFEVVQAYRVTTELDRVERCLFVPLKLLSFADPRTVDRLRVTLSRAALTPAAFRQLTSEYGAVEIVPQTPRVTPGHLDVGDFGSFVLTPGSIHAVQPQGGAVNPALGSIAAALATTGVTMGAGAAATPPATDAAVPSGVAPATAEAIAAPLSLTARLERGPAGSAAALAAAKGWNLDQIGRLASLTTRVPLRSQSDAVFVPDDAVLLSLSVREPQASRLQLRKRDDSEVPAGEGSVGASFILEAPVAFRDLQTIALQSSSDHDVSTTLALRLSVNNSVVTLDVPVQFRSRTAIATPQEVIRFGAAGASPELVAHLEANRLHYSRAVFATLDGAAIAGLLARFTYRGLPLAQLVDPQPVALTANFLVFRLNVPRSGALDDTGLAEEQADFRAFLSSHGLDASVAKSEIVPLPTGGVFAEAVLGRYNAAEKIDLKRFWNWQDSPIPIVAPEIASISAASRAEAENVTPGQLGTPVLNIQAPVALPAAAGVAPLLAAIQNANLFRDMSGMAQTAALAQSAVTTTGAGATAAGAQAGKNLFTVMDQHTQRMRIAADLAGSIIAADKGGAAAGGQTKSGQTVSERGGQLNAAESLGQKFGAGGASGASGAATASPAGGTSADVPTAAAAPTPTLQQQTLNQQTGSAVAAAAQKVVKAAVSPVTPAQRKTSAAPARADAPGQSLVGAVLAAPEVISGVATDLVSGALDKIAETSASSMVRVRINIFFDPTDGVAVGGDSSAALRRMSSGSVQDQLLLGLAGSSGQALVGGFDLAKAGGSTLMLQIFAKASSGGGELSGQKNITLPDSFFAGDDRKTLEVHVRPVLRRKTLKFTGLQQLNLDPDKLDDRLMASGISKVMLAAAPEFTVISMTEFSATVKYFTGALLITQIL